MASGPNELRKRIQGRLSSIAPVVELARSEAARKAFRTAGLLATLLFLLRFWSKKGSTKAKQVEERLALDLSKVGRRVKQDEYDYDPEEYDVVIVGGGTAGCVLASRISEDPAIRVLLLEAGKSHLKDNLAALIPVTGSKAFRTRNDFNFWTQEQKNAGGRKRYWPRAKLLGGCSNTNASCYHYGSPSDYDEWARLQKGQEGADAWSYKEFHPYFFKFERFTPSRDYPDVDPSERGASGLVDVGYFGYNSVASKAFLEACANVGVPRIPDFNTSRGTRGASKMMTYIDPNGRRVTMETAYLTPTVLARPNLTVATKAYVTRILFDTKDPSKLRAIGVEFVDAVGTKFQVKARKEVVVAAGAVNTPQILMLSGIGPASHLKDVNIPLIQDLPGVGSHLMDHLVIDWHFKDKSKTGLSYLTPKKQFHKVQLMMAILYYKLTGKGPLTSNIAEAAAFIRTDDPQLFPPDKYPAETKPEDVTSDRNAPDIEIFSSPVIYQDFQFGYVPPDPHFGLHPILLRPKSTGQIRLRSNNPQDPPVIDPNYFSDPNDIKVLLRGSRFAQSLVATEPLASLVDHTSDDSPHTHHNLHKMSDEELKKAILRRAETLYHPCCTARMAPLEDGGVVDPQLRVYGVPNLRIADASVFPTIVSGHTAAPVIAIAEKAADLIKVAVKSN